MLTKEELNTFLTLEFKVQDSANHVASVLKEWEEDYGKDENNTWWELEPKDEKDFSKGVGVHGCESSFSADLLCKTDEELYAYIEQQKEKERLWLEARRIQAKVEEEMRQQEKQKRYQRLLRMSKKELLTELGVPEQWLQWPDQGEDNE